MDDLESFQGMESWIEEGREEWRIISSFLAELLIFTFYCFIVHPQNLSSSQVFSKGDQDIWQKSQ